MILTAAQSEALAGGQDDVPWLRCLLAAIVLGGVFFVVSHDVTSSRKMVEGADAQYQERSEDLAVTRSQLNVSSAVGYFALGGFGLLCLVRTTNSDQRLFSGMNWLLLAYVCWCALSYFWSEAPNVTIRKIAILVLFSTAALGVAYQFTLTGICTICLMVAVSYTLLGLVVEIGVGNFMPWKSWHRFSGTLHPNGQSLNCALIILSGWFARYPKKVPITFRWLVVLLAACILLLTKSRTTTLALTIAITAVFVSGTRPATRNLATAVIVTLAAMVTFGFACTGAFAGDRLSNLVTMGRSEHVTTLSGRVPLWYEMLGEIRAKPWLGHGYGAFWNAERTEEYSATFFWAIPSGHSCYLDTILTVGGVGAVLLFSWWFLALGMSATRYLRTSSAGYGFLFAVIALGVVHGLAESKLILTSFSSFVMTAGILRMSMERCVPSTDRST